MMRFYEDAGLSIPATKLMAMQAADGSSAPVDLTFWFGSTETDRSYYAASDPGVDDIVVSITGGATLPATALRLALAAEDLATATPGAALTIGTEIASGAGAVAVHVRVDTAALTAGIYTNLALSVTPLISQYTGV